MALSPMAVELLVRFRELGNPVDPHPYDKERWRQFVIQAHTDGGEILSTDVAAILREKWADEIAVDLGGRYHDARLLLRDYDWSRQA